MGFLRAVRVLMGILALAAIAATFAALAVVVGSFALYLRDSGGWAALDYSEAEELVDLLVDGGFGPATLDPDDPLLAERVIVVTEAMNERTARYVTERLLHLDALDSSAPIDLRLSTSGGWLDAAFAIVDTMRGIEAPVDVTAVGGCYSAGTVVLAAATGERRATPDAMLSVHVNDYHPGDEFDPDTRELSRFRGIYKRYTDVPPEWLEPRQGDNQYYLDAEQSLELGLIDEIAAPAWEAPEAPVEERERPAA